MTHSQNKVVSLADYRAARQITRPTPVADRRPNRAQALPSSRSLEHRRRMLGFLRTLRPLLR